MKSKCAIVIPVYKKYLTVFEHASLNRTCAVLGKNHDIFFVCPDSLEFSSDYDNKVHIGIERFDDGFFKSVDTYSKLCETPEFYDRFIRQGYEWMLICQLDAWVFFDRLEYFMDLDYDYYGGTHYDVGPWIGLHNGNGGLSLRKLSVFKHVCETADFSKCVKDEDCAFTRNLAHMFNLAPVDLCLTFSIQHNPTKFEYLRDIHNLPMGCHQPYKSCIWHSVWSRFIPVDYDKILLPYGKQD